MALLWNINGASELQILEYADNTLHDPIPLPGMVATELSISAGGSMVAMTVEGPDKPPTVELVDPRTREWERIDREPSSGPLSAPPTLETITARDGLEFTGWLFRPPEGVESIGAMMFLHGGPEGQGRPGYNEFFPPLLEAGITVFLPNVRGSGGFGRSFMHADDREKRFAAIDDVADAALFLVERGLAPADRLACCGWSYGGYLTQAALTFHPQLFAAGISICGMSDLNTWYRNTEPWIAAAAYSKYGHPVSDRELLDQLSPLLRAHALTAPLLLVHGLNDTNVPPSESLQMYDALRALGRTVEQLQFDDDGHRDRQAREPSGAGQGDERLAHHSFRTASQLLNDSRSDLRVYWNYPRGKSFLRQVGAQQEEANMRGGGILGVIVLVWLLIGVVAAYQRDYFKTDASNCATAGTIALTVVAGPLNYAGANPKVADCDVKLPQPSQ